ncbi:MAG: tripartite tricarboxylate transporter substrate binding protein [Pseudomonas sp.]
MTRFSRSLLLPAACLLAAGAAAPSLAADAYPSRPITLVVPFPPGGGADVMGRVVAQKLGEVLGQPIVVDNKAGAGTIIGASYVAKARSDGYTLLISSGSTFTINPALRKELPYAPGSFDPLGIVGQAPLVLLANAQVPVQSVKDFVRYVSASPGKYSYGSFGSGSTSHFAAEGILAATGLKMSHVPYRGSAPAMTDLIGGQIPFSVDTVTAAMAQLRGGRIRAIAVTSAKRSASLPNVPTMAESGYPQVNMETWLALAAPKGLNPDVRGKLERALARVLEDSATRAKLADQGLEPSYSDGAAMAELINRELPAMRALVQRANMTVD